MAGDSGLEGIDQAQLHRHEHGNMARMHAELSAYVAEMKIHG
jgi:hypothetical protein